MNWPLDQRPIVVALAGPNGAGKTTFYHAHLQPAGLHFINADRWLVNWTWICEPPSGRSPFFRTASP